jgi:glutathione S-transferase
MLRVWGRRDSYNVQKVLWCIGELGIEYERIDAGAGFGVTDTPDYLLLNPNGRVPTIEDDGFVLWESNAIVRYLSAKHGEGTLCPSDPRQRADADRWMTWQTTTAGPNMRLLVMALFRTRPEERDNDAVDRMTGVATAHWTILDRWLADRDYVAGASLTMGDVPIGAYAYRWFSMPVSRPLLPHLQAWYERLIARPAYRETVMLPLEAPAPKPA